MEKENRRKLKDRFVYVKDDEGREYICRVDELKDPEKLTEEEKNACFDPPHWDAGP
jgi:hypothetical protein